MKQFRLFSRDDFREDYLEFKQRCLDYQGVRLAEFEYVLLNRLQDGEAASLAKDYLACYKFEAMGYDFSAHTPPIINMLGIEEEKKERV